MKQDELINAKCPELRGSLAALQRAAQSAREIAINTNTAIVIVRNGQRVRLTAAELRKEQELKTSAVFQN